jgi:hypothetical protein
MLVELLLVVVLLLVPMLAIGMNSWWHGRK